MAAAETVTVLSRDEFAQVKGNSCCEGSGVPLDDTLRKIVYRQPNGFFIESGGQVTDYILSMSRYVVRSFATSPPFLLLTGRLVSIEHFDR